MAWILVAVLAALLREREHLEGRWSRGDEVSTEQLRVTLQRHRSCFRGLLAA